MSKTTQAIENSKRQRIEGDLKRTFVLELIKRDDAIDGETDPANELTTATEAEGADAGTDADATKDNVILTFAFSSEEPYMRSNWFDEPWIEVLGHDAGECDLSRLSDGAAVLANHGYGATVDSPMRLIGATQKAWIENKRGMVEVKLSRRDGMEGLLQDIEDGIVRNVSVGYQILERVLVKDNGEGSPDEYRVAKWLPMEVSLVDIPADATVGLERSIERPADGTQYRVIDLPDLGLSKKGNTMSQAQNNPAPGGDNNPDIEAVCKEATEKAVAAERTRSTDIRLAVRNAGMDDTLADEMIASGVATDAAREAVLAKLAERTKAQGITSRADIVTLQDETETRRDMMTASLLNRCNVNEKLPEGARQYRGMSLMDLSRECLEIAGVKTRGMDRMEIAKRSFESTSDLPAVLANVANKSLRTAYLAAPRTFVPWTRQITNPDFKQMSRIALSDAPALEAVPEAGEFKRGAFTDGKEVYSLATYGKVVPMSRQAIINDDLNAFSRLPALMAMAAANIENDTVYGIVTGNAALSDTIALFNASHNNLTGTGTVISVASLGVGRATMRVQKSPAGAILNIPPKYLIVPAALETIANQFTSSNFVSAKSSDINPFNGVLDVIVEGRLDANSATAWYFAADYNVVDTIEYCFLEGQEGAYIETRQGFDIDGMEFKVRLDFAAKAIDYRGLYKNVGA